METSAGETDGTAPNGRSKLNLLLGFTGSVATIKDEALIKLLIETGMFNIRAVFTRSALHFKTPG